MSLVCCLLPEEGCLCEINLVCGGVHIINALCGVHARVQNRSRIHEAGQKPIETVESVQ
ncbi:hypothetical protein SEA_DRYAD_61 [Streptomyces phage Dryad]|nr:hypothetical protein SEA_DRYAD_61 [Streptomyces phage Dryad]